MGEARKTARQHDRSTGRTKMMRQHRRGMAVAWIRGDGRLSRENKIKIKRAGSGKLPSRYCRCAPCLTGARRRDAIYRMYFSLYTPPKEQPAHASSPCEMPYRPSKLISLARLYTGGKRSTCTAMTTCSQFLPPRMKSTSTPDHSPRLFLLATNE